MGRFGTTLSETCRAGATDVLLWFMLLFSPARARGFLLSLLLGTALALRSEEVASTTPRTVPLQGAALLKTDFLGVFAHPDDETGIAPLIADLALRQGRTVAHVYCTRGEGGGNMVGTQYGPSLGLLREAELRACLALLGVRAVYFLEREDFAYTESLRVTLEKWNHEETLRRLVRIVRLLRPDVMVTMNPAPTPGQHGNHQAAGWLATEAFDAAADARRFPEQLVHEGLQAWQPRKLYFGGNGPFMATLATTNLMADGRIPARIAAEALANHRSQGFGNFGNSPWFVRPQRLQLVKSVVPFLPEESDLFRGLPREGDSNAVRRVFASADVLPERAPLAFVARPAVENYRSFVQREGIEHAAAGFNPDLPVVAGEVNTLLVGVGSSGKNDRPKISWPAGWKAMGEPRPAGSNRFAVRVAVPSEAGGDQEVTAEMGRAEGKARLAKARLHVLPRFEVLSVKMEPRLQREFEWPNSGPDLIIPATNLWEGKVRDAADSSAVVRVLRADKTMFVEVRVADDHVVSNIAPDDIKGHWRSDSVELCFDPHPGSEHTLGCYKLGIFPFDATGHVRGVRDADAKPGVIEDTAPGTRLVAWKTPDGYVVRAAIPFLEIGTSGKSGTEIGFNVLIYDGDKTNAAPGENINKSRLAWAPRGGVQGRPEDWGRLSFR